MKRWIEPREWTSISVDVKVMENFLLLKEELSAKNRLGFISNSLFVGWLVKVGNEKIKDKLDKGDFIY